VEPKDDQSLPGDKCKDTLQNTLKEIKLDFTAKAADSSSDDESIRG
jgi:hypothetical protein